MKKTLLLSLLLCFLSKSNSQTIWDGPTKLFQKCDYTVTSSEFSQDRITDNVWITRADNQGIFNIVTETSFDSGTSPSDTEWFIGTTETFLNNPLNYCGETPNELVGKFWYDLAPGNMEYGLVGNDYVLHLITDNIYIDIKFLSWTSNGNGGGFSYERSSNPDGETTTPALTYDDLTTWNGPTVTFGKCDYADETLEVNQDHITDNIWITRADNQGIFNIVTETSFDSGTSPSDTEWFVGTTADFLDNPEKFM